MPRPKLHTIVLTLLLIILGGCSSPSIITVWKNQHAFPGKYNKIMLVGIVNRNDTGLRRLLENHFKDELESMGYNAVSSISEFGPNGLRDMGQEATYISLCNKGIDAVITIALTDNVKEILSEPAVAYTHPARYYYNRIWHLRDEQLRLPREFSDSVMTYSWEMILFDLSTLEPHYIAQTRPNTGTVRQSIDHAFWHDMIRKMKKEKFLKTQAALTKPSEKTSEKQKAF